MKFTLAWLKEHLDTSAPAEEIRDRLTMIGLEVELVEDTGKAFAPFRIARVISAEKHPNADRLRVCIVDPGDGSRIQVVCGAPNARTGMIGVFAPAGHAHSRAPASTSRRASSAASSRTACSSPSASSASPTNHDGIVDLPADAPVGQAYAAYAGLDDAGLRRRGDAEPARRARRRAASPATSPPPGSAA